MSISEQELFGLMAVAQEQQNAATIALEKLEAQRAELDATIATAKVAVLEMEKAGRASAIIIEKATRNAVSEAVKGALSDVRDQTSSTVSDSVGPSVKALKGATGDAVKAGDELRAVASSISWKWTGVLALIGCVLLMTVVALSMLLVPSPGEIADLRATASDLKSKGGKVELSYCGSEKRLCAKVDLKANNGRNGWGDKGEYMILQGY